MAKSDAWSLESLAFLTSFYKVADSFVELWMIKMSRNRRGEVRTADVQEHVVVPSDELVEHRVRYAYFPKILSRRTVANELAVVERLQGILCWVLCA